MHTLHAIEFTAGHDGFGFQETNEDGNLIALYGFDGEQLARIADADRYSNPKWKVIRKIGEFSDSDEFWFMVTDEWKFSTRLRRLREEQELSVAALAEAAGMTRQAVDLLEKGERAPSLDSAERLAIALGKKLQIWDGCGQILA